MKIGIYGAGSIGCYIGGRMVAAGHQVTFYCRERSYQKLSQNGLELSDLNGYHHKLTPDQLRLTTNLAEVLDTDLVMICVKSAATEQVASEIRSCDTLNKPSLISFQNGVSNVPRLKKMLPEWEIMEGMVPFNVAELKPSHFHQGSDGTLMIKKFVESNQLKIVLDAAKLQVEFRDDMLEVQWAKVLFNLNNSINALSGLTLRNQLTNRMYRKCLAQAQLETLRILKQANIQPAQLTPVPANIIPHILQLPNWLFKLISRKMLAIDPLARSSMQDDLNLGRTTEVDWINGEVVRLANTLGGNAPINSYFIEQIKLAENNNSSLQIGPEEMLTQLKLIQH